MCESLARSAKKVASLGAFLAGANGIAGCAGSTREAMTAWSAERTVAGYGYQLEPPEAGFPSNDKMIWEIAGGTEDIYADLERQKLRREFAADHEAEGKRGASFEGFRSYDIPPELMGEYVRAAYPRSWTRSTNVREVGIRPKNVPMTLPGYENSSEYAHCSIPFDGSPGEITVTTEAMTVSPKQVLDQLFSDKLAHEFAHANDWRSSPDLSTEESVELRYQILQLVKSPGRPKFSYPEGIEARGGKVAAQTDQRMVEYFAELVSFSLAMRLWAGEGMKKLNWARWDAELSERLQNTYEASGDDGRENARAVHWYFSHIDPDYEPWVAAVESDAVKQRIEGAYAETTLEKGISKGIPDPDLQTAFRHALGVEADAFSRQNIEWQHRKALLQYRHALESRLTTDPAGVSVHERDARVAWDRMVVLLSDFRNVRWGYATQYPKEFFDAAKSFAAAWTPLSAAEHGRLRTELKRDLAILIAHEPENEK